MRRIFTYLLFLLLAPLALQAQVAIDATNFPDNNFRTYVATFDTDGDGTLSQTEIKNVTSISVDNMSIAQLDGIEFFTAITSLKCDNNNLTSLDLSSNTKLKTLSCHNNSLTSLNVVGCTALEKMYCQTNQLVSLTVASTALTELYANNNSLTSVDITGCPNLATLRLYRNPDLQYVDFSGNSKMIKLEFFECAVTSIDVSNMADLNWLSVTQNQLTKLDVTHNPLLTNLTCYENQLTELDLSQNPLIKVLSIEQNKFSEIDVSMLPELATFYCNDNLLKKLDVTHNTKLKILKCQNNLLTTLDLSKNTSLTGNQLIIGPQKFPQEIEIFGDNRGIIAVPVLPSTDESVVTWDQFKTVKLGAKTWKTKSIFEDNKIQIYHDNLEEDVELNEHSNYSYVEYEYVAPCGTSSVSSSYKTMKVTMRLNPFVMYVNPNSFDRNGGFYSGTLMLGYPVEVPEGIVAYTASSVSEVGEDGSQSLIMDEVAVAGDVLPANTPVYLRASESAGFYQFRSLVGDATPVTVPDGNLLQGTLSSYRVTSGQVLTLGREKDSGEIGFWPYLGTSSYLYVKKNRCYVDASLVSDGNSANGFFFNFDGDTNAVEQPAVEINTDNEGPWYNLQGVQLMEKPSQKGIYISNGKKIIIK